MVQSQIDGTRLRQSIEELSKIGRQSSGGISRFTFSRADMQAREYVSNLMKDSGLTVSVDQFGNIIGRMRSVSEGLPAVMCGSHIDTVPNGGPLDGAYGVLSGIEAARTIHEQTMPIKSPLEVVAFTEEEGVRFPSFIGSLGLTGALRRQDAYALKDDNDVTFERALKDAGLNPAELQTLHRKPGEIKAYVELHIEQGPELDRERIPIGIVKSIVGLGDLKVELEGIASHAGTTPMPLRHDALLGASRVIVGVNDLACRKRHTVSTVGSLTVSPNASNVIPGKVALTVDFRDPTWSGLQQLRNDIVRETKRVGKEMRLKVRIEKKSLTKPARMSGTVINAIKSSARSLGVVNKEMNSGAGHDCQNMARITDVGMIFVPSVRGVSHVPNEWTRPEHLEAGANVLLNTLLLLLN